MVKVGRILIALAILLSGVAMIPFVELPSGQLGWQLYAGVYDATLVSNYDTGRPGSFFTFTGSNFPPNSLATITAAGPVARGPQQGNEVLGMIMTDENGRFTFLLNTEGADVGIYLVSATVDANATATDTIELIDTAPLRPAEAIAPILYLGGVVYLPVVINN
jgi:hypothetical protein